MTESAKSAVEFMTKELPPATKSGFVRAMLPAIEDALRAGHTMKAIWEQIQKYNSALGYKEFSVYVRRIRRKPANQTAPITGKKTAVEEEIRASKSSELPFDPLANVKRAEAKRPGFHYRGTQDLEELIHGRKNHHGEQESRSH